MSKPEWFKLNPTKFLQDSLIDSLTTEELGCCIRLMCRQWTDGFVPDDLGKLARLCRTDASRMGGLWVTLCDFFPVIEDGKRANRFMFVEREIVQTEMDKRSTDGRKAAEKRWNQTVNKSDAAPNGLPMPHPMQEENKKESKIGTNQRQKKGSAAGRLLSDPHALATFKEAWQLHPRRKDSSGGLCPPGNQAKSIAVLLERFKEGVTWDEVPKVAREYQNYPKVKEGYAQNFEVFWGENGHWFQMLTIVRGEK